MIVDLVLMAEMLETGKVTPIIDTCYPLSDVPEALKYIGEGHAKGKVIIMMPNLSDSEYS